MSCWSGRCRGSGTGPIRAGRGPAELPARAGRHTVEQHELAFTAASPAAYLEAERTRHPMAIAGFEVLERVGQADLARERLLRILQEGNEDATAFRSTSRYVVVTATRP